MEVFEMWIRRRLKVIIILVVLVLLGLGIFSLSKSLVKNGYNSLDLVEKEDTTSKKAPKESESKENTTIVTYDTEQADTDKENYISDHSNSTEEIEETTSILSYIEENYKDKISKLPGDNSADPSNTLVSQYADDIDFSTALSKYNYIAIVYGARIVDFLNDNCVVYSYKPDDTKEQYIVYDYSDLNAFERESKIGQEDSLNITCNASSYENYNGADIVYTKGVKIQ